MESRASREKRESLRQRELQEQERMHIISSMLENQRENQPLYIPETRGES